MMHLRQQLHTTDKRILLLNKNIDLTNWQQFSCWIVSIEVSRELIFWLNAAEQIQIWKILGHPSKI